MSGDEDTELRDLIIQTLENNGIIGKIKAELRASIFLALEEEDFKNKIPLHRKELNIFTSSSEGKIAIALIRDFLQYFCLDYTLAVFESEVSCSNELIHKNELYHMLKLEKTKVTDGPLIAELISSILSGYKNNADWPHKLGGAKLSSKRVKEASSEENKVKPTFDILESEPYEKSITDFSQNSTIDPFFDDPFPLEGKNNLLLMGRSNESQDSLVSRSADATGPLSLQKKGATVEQVKDNAISDKKNDIKGSSQSGLSSLQDLPALGIGNQPADRKAMETLDKNLAEMGFDGATGAEEEDYEDDNFHSSVSDKSSLKSLNKNSGGKRIKQDNQDNSEQSIEEDIEEDLSAAADDLLVSSLSLGEDATSDHTVSQSSATGLCDYMENCC